VSPSKGRLGTRESAGLAGAAASPPPARPFRVIGTRVAKLDAVEKVTGAVQYLPDLELPGMVWGKILRTRVPHARITRIDTSRAEALPGVLGVVTGRNVAQRPFWPSRLTSCAASVTRSPPWPPRPRRSRRRRAG
jgi:CO/xanthine dehydrogenase Mo-binding subunit